MWPNEKRFADILDKQKRKWIYPSPKFKVDNTTYRPDFYLPEEHLYVEVMGTKEAFNANKNKIARFQKLYPQIKLEIVDMIDKIKVSVWMSTELKERLRKVAEQKHWSMSLLNEIVLERYLKDKKVA